MKSERGNINLKMQRRLMLPQVMLQHQLLKEELNRLPKQLKLLLLLKHHLVELFKEKKNKMKIFI